VVRVVASEASTQVDWESPTGSISGSETVMSGEFAHIETDAASNPLLVTCSKPCLVMLYNTGTTQLPCVVWACNSSKVARWRNG